MATEAVTITSLTNAAMQHSEELKNVPVLALEKDLQYATLVMGVASELTVQELAGTAHLRPHNGSENVQTGLTIKPRTLTTYVGDTIMYFKPETLRATVFAKRLLGSNNQSGYPLEAEMVAYLLSQSAGNIRKELFKAVRNGSGTTTTALFNGWNTIAATEIAATNISTGNKNLVSGIDDIDDTNAGEILKDFVDTAQDELLESGETKILAVSRKIYNHYNNWYAENRNGSAYNTQFKQTFLEGYDGEVIVVPFVGLKDSQYIHLTTKSNLLVGVDNSGDFNTGRFREVTNPFEYQFVHKMNFGVQFESINSGRLLVGKFDNAQS